MKVYKTKVKNKKRIKWICFSLSFFLFVGGIFAYLILIVDPIIIKSTIAQIDSYATTQISKAIKTTLENTSFDYSDFVNITYTTSGEVSSITTNTANLNMFSRLVDIKSQDLIDEIADMGVEIAIGTFTGFSFLIGRGTKIHFNLVPIGSLLTKFNSTFQSAGINQTLHTLNISINTSIVVVMPLKSETITFSTEVLVCENLIVGKVPNVYLES